MSQSQGLTRLNSSEVTKLSIADCERILLQLREEIRAISKILDETIDKIEKIERQIHVLSM